MNGRSNHRAHQIFEVGSAAMLRNLLQKNGWNDRFSVLLATHFSFYCVVLMRVLLKYPTKYEHIDVQPTKLFHYFRLDPTFREACYDDVQLHCDALQGLNGSSIDVGTVISCLYPHVQRFNIQAVSLKILSCRQ